MENATLHIEMITPVFPVYSLIVIASIIIGVIIACMIMFKAGLKRGTIIYTALLTFVCILVCGLFFSAIISGGKASWGFTGAGGVIGLLIGSFISLLIHRDHESETLISWIISAPLMYGLSKSACHIVGCCHGIRYSNIGYVIYPSEGIPRFPVQLSETVIFLLIFGIGIILFFHVRRKIISAFIVETLCIIAKFSTDFLRQSHYESKNLLSTNQITAIVCGAAAIIITIISDRLLNRKDKIS